MNFCDFDTSNYTAQMVGTYMAGEDYDEWEVRLMGIYDPDQIGKNVVIEFETYDVNNNKTFYTDSNGLEMMERIIDHRDTWDLVLAKGDNISANYYPVQSAVLIRDSEN
jgi:hypothetical protein